MLCYSTCMCVACAAKTKEIHESACVWYLVDIHLPRRIPKGVVAEELCGGRGVYRIITRRGCAFRSSPLQRATHLCIWIFKKNSRQYQYSDKGMPARSASVNPSSPSPPLPPHTPAVAAGVMKPYPDDGVRSCGGFLAPPPPPPTPPSPPPPAAAVSPGPYAPHVPSHPPPLPPPPPP